MYNIDYIDYIYYILYTLWLFNIAMENGPFMDDFPIKTSMFKWFSIHGVYSVYPVKRP